MDFTVFYSWQSDLPNATNRGFIEKALEIAAKLIRDDESIRIEPVIDRDTIGVPGAPDIAETILRKIEQSQVCVCDVSITNESDPSRPTPNPNVLIELGYALKALGPSRIIMVMNTAFGGPELLPFDLRMKRVVTYNAPEAAKERATERRRLGSVLERGLRAIIEEVETQLTEDVLDQATESQVIEIWDDKWLTTNRTTAKEGLSETGFPSFIEVRFALANYELNVSQKELLDAARRAQIHTFGWPIGVVLDTPEYKPRPRSDGIVAEILVKDFAWMGGKKNSYDYWALRNNGDFFLLKSIFEDEGQQSGETRGLLFNIRIVRIAEILLYCARLYSNLGIAPSTQVHIGIKHSGLGGRLLGATSSRLFFRRSTCAEEEIETLSQVALQDIEPSIVDLVKEFASPLFMLFEFQEFGDDVYNQIVKEYIKGKVT